MPRLFIKQSQVTSDGRTKAMGSSSNNTSFFRRRRKNVNQDQLYNRDKPVQGSEAVAFESQRVNAKTFQYPETGFEIWIENTLLYTMIRESNIFPAGTVLAAIDEENFTQYFAIKQQDQQQHSLGDDESDGDDDNDDGADDSERRKTAASEVSYAQLTALLALAGDEWPSSSEVPQKLCSKISKEIIKYANKNDLDREQELKELLDPLITYAKGRGRKQALQLLPWFAALTVSTVNPLAFYTTYMTMLAANADQLSKGDRSDRNTINMAEMGKKHGNVEKASLLDEDYYDEDDDE